MTKAQNKVRKEQIRARAEQIKVQEDKIKEHQAVKRQEVASARRSMVLLKLFGTDAPKTFQTLNTLLPPTKVFDDTSTRKIRNLLVGLNYFNWEQEQPLGIYYAPDGGSGQANDFEFTLRATPCQTDTTELDSMLQNDEQFRLLMEPLVGIQRYFPEHYGGEMAVGHQFYHIARLASDFVNLLQPKKLSISPGEPTTVPPGYSNHFLFLYGCWKVNGAAIGIYNCKVFPLVSKELMADPKNIKNDLNKLEPCLRQQVENMLIFGYLYGFVGDARNMIFVEFDFEAIEKEMLKPRNPNVPPKLYIKLSYSNVHQLSPSYLQCNFSWLLKMAKGITQAQREKIRKFRQFYSKRVQADNGLGSLRSSFENIILNQ